MGISNVPAAATSGVRSQESALRQAQGRHPESRKIIKTTVIPTKVGIQRSLDSRLCGNDDPKGLSSDPRLALIHMLCRFSPVISSS